MRHAVFSRCDCEADRVSPVCKAEVLKHASLTRVNTDDGGVYTNSSKWGHLWVEFELPDWVKQEA